MVWFGWCACWDTVSMVIIKIMATNSIKVLFENVNMDLLFVLDIVVGSLTKNSSVSPMK